MLFGIVPGKPNRLGQGVEPNISLYQTMMVYELIEVASTQLYSAYANAPLKVKVELLVYMMDFIGYTKYFQMLGPAAYRSCNMCNIVATRQDHKMMLLGHENYQEIPKRDYDMEVIISFFEYKC